MTDALGRALKRIGYKITNFGLELSIAGNTAGYHIQRFGIWVVWRGKSLRKEY